MAIFCVLYYVLSFCQSIPCIVKLVITKKSNDYSLLNRAFQYSALICWTIYLCSTVNWETEFYLVIIGFIDVLLLTTENIFILKYYKRR